MFSAEANVVASNAIIFVRAILDNDATVEAKPDSIQFSRDLTRQTRSAVFVFPNVRAGNHRVSIQAFGSGGRGVLNDRITVVHYTK
jgi:hypothetical protein